MVEYNPDKLLESPIKQKLEMIRNILALDEQIKAGDESKSVDYWTEVCNLVGRRF